MKVIFFLLISVYLIECTRITRILYIWSNIQILPDIISIIMPAFRHISFEMSATLIVMVNSVLSACFF